jgi:hypothetical protein
MAYDEYRERGRFDRDEEFGRSDYERQTFGRGGESRWPGESSWGYGREYNEGYPERLRSGQTRSFEGEGRPDLTGGGREFHPETTRRYRLERYGSDFGWQPEGGYGQGSGDLYGWSPGEQGFESRSDRTPERWRTEFTTSEVFDEPGYYYGTSSHLARVPRGRFTGRGPKSYQRSDERIREDVSEEFSQNGELDASDIEILVASCVVTLEGEVEDREQKRLAEDIAEAAPGVREVNNNLKVKKGFFARLFGTDDDREKDERDRSSARESA